MKPPRFFKRVRGATPEDIMITLADFAAQVPAEQEIVELGVFQGRTALQLAWGARQGNGAHVTGIDAWALEGNTYDAPFTDDSSRRWAMHWVQSLGYSRDITLVNAFSQDVAARWAISTEEEGQDGQKVGLLFVDADHSKEGARRDILSWAPHLAPDAVIAVDDYGHPDWPGVAEAVNELVAEGVLAPIELYHDRLAVTRLKVTTAELIEELKPTAITSEGVSPSPYPAVDGQVAADTEPEMVLSDPDRATLEAEWRRVDPEGVAALEESATALEADSGVSTDWAWKVTPEEAVALTVPVGPVADLNTIQLRALAKHRGIVLGVRKDKRDLILQALRDGR